MSRVLVEYTVFVLDCAKDANEYLYSLFKLIACKYFEMTKTNKDVYRVIFFNKPNSKAINVLTDWSLYKLTDLEQFKAELKKVETPSDHESIIDVLSAAVDCFPNEIKGAATKKIVFMTSLFAPLTSRVGVKQQVEQLRSRLSTLDIWLYVIGPQVQVPIICNETDVLKMRETIQPIGEISIEQKQNFEILRKIYRQTNGVVIDLANGLDLVHSLRPAVKAPFPWYAELSVGEDIKVPIACYRTTRQPESISFKPVNYQQEDKHIVKEVTWHDVHSHEEVPPSDVVSGYLRRGKIVILNDEGEKARNSADTERCLSIVAFVNEHEIKKELYFLDGSMNVIVADKRKMQPDKGLSLLIQVMQHKKKVAIAKRVYNRGYEPLLYCIFPCPDHRARCLLMAKLPYSHEFVCTFHSGPALKLDLDVELKANMYGFLDNMQLPNEAVNPLPEYMKHNRSLVYKYQLLALKNVPGSEIDQPHIRAAPELVARSEEYADALIEYLKEKQENQS